jgi:hypothetical protein
MALRSALLTSILRRGVSETSDLQVFKQWAYIETFVRHWIRFSIAIPNDSPAFREEYLNSLFGGGYDDIGLAADRHAPPDRVGTTSSSFGAQENGPTSAFQE